MTNTKYGNLPPSKLIVGNFREGLIFAIFVCRETIMKVKTMKYVVRTGTNHA